MESIQNSTNPSLKKMWCHLCKSDFEINNQSNYECPKCKGNFCEEIVTHISESEDPRNFIPFGEESNSHRSTNNQNIHNRQTHQPIIRNRIQQGIDERQPTVQYQIQIQTTNHLVPTRDLNSILANLFPNTAQRMGGGIFGGSDGNFENILDFIMRNDPNVYGNPPAAEQSKADTEESTISECSVCKDEFSHGEDLLRMPCNHFFHPNCLHTWLKLHNSCPTCRFELPTDNQDYERRKQDNQNRNSQNATRRS